MFQQDCIYDYKAKNTEFIKRAVKRRIEEGIKQFAILPMGFWGTVTKSLLEKEFDIKPKGCFDNYQYNNQDVHPISKMENMDLANIVLLIVIEKEELRSYIYQQVSLFVPNSLIELVPLWNAEQKRIFEESEKIHLDFLCTGFHKCGTTSLHKALQQNPNIFLPKIKETFFMMSVIENNHKKFKQNYPVSMTNKSMAQIGGIEPTYPPYADSVYQYFGKDLNIIFLVRNPVEALKSAFKMSMREVDGRGFELIRKHKIICPDLMKEYIESDYKRFIYIDFINMYERYYPKSQIKIVITEELFQNTSEQMDAIQKFIGLPEKSRIQYKKLPHENKGDTVFGSLGGAYVNNSLNVLRMGIEDVNLYAQIDEIRKKVFNYTTVDFNFNQYENIWEEVYDNYYSDSVKKLEERIGQSLKGIWY